ncbi:MAG: hypothetical protein U0O18_02980, partial [Clostridia bacterium]
MDVFLLCQKKISPSVHIFALWYRVSGIRVGKKTEGLGAKATEEQGVEGIRAPSQSAWIWEKARGLGAKATEEQGLEGIRAPSQSARIWKKA